MAEVNAQAEWYIKQLIGTGYSEKLKSWQECEKALNNEELNGTFRASFEGMHSYLTQWIKEARPHLLELPEGINPDVEWVESQLGIDGTEIHYRKG
jgi:hypothetical protein